MNLKISSILASLLALIAILFKSVEVLPNILIQKLEWLGDRSYSIYLVHMPLLYLAKYSLVTKFGNYENRIIPSILAVVASILLGSISYSKIENKYRNIGKSRVTGIKAISGAMLLTLLIPLALFASMDRGLNYQYWGLDRNIPVPPLASLLDPKCLRDSKIGPPCVYKNAGATKTVLLIGDSHAGQISQAVIDAAKNENWNAVVWAHADCHVQFQRSISGQVSDNCIDINIQMKKWVLANKPEVIIVSQFVHSDSSQKDLRNALSTLHAIVPHILLIENNPIFPDEKDFMVQRPLVMSPYKPPKSFRQSDMQIKDRNASNQLANWARNNSISTMNFNSLFCNNEICTRHTGTDWLYWDDDHLSVAGAELTIPQLIAFLKRF